MPQPVYFVIGPTASGKGDLGRELARRLGAQIVSVDSMKVYRRMDIGTAKPSGEIRRRIPHHCIDVVEPWEPFSVAQYLTCADRAIAEIRAAGAVPLAVGGTSLYIKALCEGLFEGPPADPELRRRLADRARQEGLAALHAELSRLDAHAAQRIHPNDQRRILRALEVRQLTGRPISSLQQQWDTGLSRYEVVMIGLRRSREDLHRRINRRVMKMIDAGLIEEVRTLLGGQGLSPQAAQAVGYAEIIEHLQGRLSLVDAIEQVKINTRKLAKKQRTWQRRWTAVRWFDAAPDEPTEALADRVIAEVGFE